MPRFVILRHETPPGYPRPTHFDLMLEWGEMLRTWACQAMPTSGATLFADELAAHRREYLDYEGEVSAGRGSVTRAAAGEFDLLENTPDLVRVRLHSPQLRGTLRLAPAEADSARWTVFLDSGAGILERDAGTLDSPGQ